MTYRTAGPQYQQVLRTSLEPVLADFEDVWSDAWLPRGTQVVFERHKLLADDLPTTATSLATLVGAHIVSTDEARPVLLGMPFELQCPGAEGRGATAGPRRCPEQRRGPTTRRRPDRRTAAVTVEHPTERVLFGFEVRDVDPAGRRPYSVIEGRAVPYDTWANVGPYLESFKPGAFKKSTGESARGLPLMLFHGRDDLWPIGVSTRWEDRPDGLWGRWKLNESAEAQRAAALAESGELAYLSIGFTPMGEPSVTPARDYNPELGDNYLDRIYRTEARLVETSIVPTPAYAEAQVSLVRAYKRPLGPDHQARLTAWRAEYERLRQEV